jgi:hypothetical protein
LGVIFHGIDSDLPVDLNEALAAHAIFAGTNASNSVWLNKRNSSFVTINGRLGGTNHFRVQGYWYLYYNPHDSSQSSDGLKTSGGKSLHARALAGIAVSNRLQGPGSFRPRANRNLYMGNGSKTWRLYEMGLNYWWNHILLLQFSYPGYVLPNGHVLLTCHGRNSWQVFYGYVTARFDAPGT